MDAVGEILREEEGRVGSGVRDIHHSPTDPADMDPASPDARRDHGGSGTQSRLVASSPYQVARERRRSGHSMVDGQLKAAAPHIGPALPEGRLGHATVDAHAQDAEAAINSDPGNAGRESGHAGCETLSPGAALANDPPQGGAGAGQVACGVQSMRAFPAEIRESQGKRGAVGHTSRGSQPARADSATVHEIGGNAEGRVGPCRFDTPSPSADAATEIRSDAGDGIGHTCREIQTHVADPATIAALRHHWRKRQAWHRAEKALTLQAKALCRGLTDGDKCEADKLYAAALGKGEHAEAAVALGFIMPLAEARDGIERHRKAVEKHLAKLAGTLPVAPFVLATRGVGIASLAGIVGEAGDLSVYGNPGKLWKRMGVAPYQGRAYATWRSRGGLTGADWVEAGYSPARRSVLWNVGACVVKAGGPLKEVYDARKALEMVKCEAIAADPEQRKLFAKDGKYAPKLHAHNRAQRYVEKRFLRELWREWRRANVEKPTKCAVPAAELFREAAE